ncbi:MAG: hypothetical protein JWQ52_963 [Phenylobacterium sp.]|jgi:serralysin|nr:hypothetical protein [Phenylobacterium sp.]
MPSTVVVDGATLIFGDTSGDLTGRSHAGDQNLAGGADILVGDANRLLNRAIGGNDTVSGSIAVGDALTIRNHARGGDDVVTASGYGVATGGVAYGDAKTMTGFASGGDDVVTVFASFSSVTGYGDAEVLRGEAHGGNDTLGGGGDQHSTLNLFGDGRVMSGRTVGGDDVLTSGAGSVYEYGDAQTLSDHARGGNDTLSAGLGLPGHTGVLFGDAQNVTDDVQCGNDRLSSTSAFSNITMYGDGQTIGGHASCGADTLSGPTGELFPVVTTMYGDGATLDGQAQGGDDVLVSGKSAADVMWGDAAVVGPHATTGADRFVFAAPNGHDQIMDFQPGKDRIELDGFGFGSFQVLASHFRTTPEGVLISFDANDDVLLRNVTVGQLSAGDFMFG